MSLELAKKVADANDFHYRWHLGAVVTRGGAVQSVGMNKPKNDPAYVEWGLDQKHCHIHAEEDAVKRIRTPKGCILYVARKCKGGTYGRAEPCKRCKKLLTAAGIKKVVYTIDDQTFGTWIPGGRM